MPAIQDQLTFGITGVSTSGNYSVVVTDANGCSATDDVNVTVHPNPTVDLGMDQETCAGGSITLDSTSGNYSVFVTDAVVRQYRIITELEYRSQHTKHCSFNFRQLFSGCNRCEWLFGNR
ncbi:hypothetical protein [Marinifilum sp.]|uniref:hypothetical protein n=1 Tax=Marinifilum sp. TaxID=2033137 RepID=UPI003BAAA055